jgi:hypothetical protein
MQQVFRRNGRIATIWTGEWQGVTGRSPSQQCKAKKKTYCSFYCKPHLLQIKGSTVRMAELERSLVSNKDQSPRKAQTALEGKK